ncbi:pyruvate kinase [Catalinimonas alkaloidigena]|uniref:Pyruvate kinase n=1 Tax=Catalinimonas alkaloidigena TaxID=1075417 RepID=A0A1G8WGC5_9BACT|nr:pyruvate kinase [Catalinimonas alkaloidigena]SDJ76590.1 pyruvate kinase [Catalinimonas alkaloidigena]
MGIPFNKTKILATVGPASRERGVLQQLIEAGADVFRLNFSHGSHEDHRKVVENIRSLNEELGTYICILQDLQGPKIRTDEVENNGVELVPGELLTISTQKMVGNAQKVSTTYQSLPEDVHPGDTILIDDGNLELKVVKVENREVVAKVIYGGILKSRKGINLPDTVVSAPSLTEKDYEDLLFGLEMDVDWVALSFVRKADDLREVKRIIAEKGKKTKVVAKIEKPQAVRNIDEIIEVADALMVARGDLGVEIPMEEVPLVQKTIVQKCNKAGKPVIIATQMMESMITNPRPTRAEANDVANAVMDGADAVMLSAETAAGSYPVRAVEAMRRVVARVEEECNDIYYKYHFDIEDNDDPELLASDSVIASACTLAQNTRAQAVCGITSSGFSAFRLIRHRPKADVFIFTRRRHLLTQLGLLWGVRTIFYESKDNTDQIIEDLKDILVEKGHLKKGDLFINTASVPLKEKRHANMVKLTVVH